MGLKRAVEQVVAQVAERKKEKNVHPAWFEQATFRVLGERDNHYTMGASYVIDCLNF